MPASTAVPSLPAAIRTTAIRTTTASLPTPDVARQTSQGSQASQPASPLSPSSPIEQSFFGALATRMRGRSRSPSAARNRSRSPRTEQPPSFMAISSPTSPTSARPDKARHFSNSSNSSSLSRSKPSRSSTSSSSGSTNVWYGRHSNSWLFNDFSVRETVKDVFPSRKR